MASDAESASATPATRVLVGGVSLRVRAAAMWGDRTARAAFLAAGLSVFAVLGFILWVLVSNSVEFFRYVSLWDFLTGTHWYAYDNENQAYGVLPLLSGTLLVTVGAVALGLPLGLATAIYLSEYASPRVRVTVKPALELLAGIPSIVYGFFAVLVISPHIQRWTAPDGSLRTLPLLASQGWYQSLLDRTIQDGATIFNAASAIVVVGIMVLPIITTLSEDALRAVPRHLREASFGLGATRWETTRKVVVPAALSGITASFVLGVSRALGESMAVALAAGTQANLTFNPVEAVQTMTAFIVQRTQGDVPHGGPAYLSLFAVGMSLFAMTWVLNALAGRFVRRYREVDR